MTNLGKPASPNLGLPDRAPVGTSVTALVVVWAIVLIGVAVIAFTVR